AKRAHHFCHHRPSEWWARRKRAFAHPTKFATIASMNDSPLILLAAGGTGGHLFPAEALGVELMKRGMRVRLATDARALRYSGLFTKDLIDVVPSETVRGRDPLSLARTGATLAAGTAVAFNLMRKLK